MTGEYPLVGPGRGANRHHHDDRLRSFARGDRRRHRSRSARKMRPERIISLSNARLVRSSLDGAMALASAHRLGEGRRKARLPVAMGGRARPSRRVRAAAGTHRSPSPPFHPALAIPAGSIKPGHGRPGPVRRCGCGGLRRWRSACRSVRNLRGSTQIPDNPSTGCDRGGRRCRARDHAGSGHQCSGNQKKKSRSPRNFLLQDPGLVRSSPDGAMVLASAHRSGEGRREARLPVTMGGRARPFLVARDC